MSGDIIASGMVEITPTGKLKGNITQESAILKIEKGGIFNGKSIIQEKETVSPGDFRGKNSNVLKIAAAK